MRFFLFSFLLAAGLPSLDGNAWAQSDSTRLASPSTAPDSAAQSRFVRGIVSELVGGKPTALVGATVVWAGTTTGTVSGSDGRFQLPVSPRTDRLVVSYVGYQPDTLRVNPNSPELTITLQAERTLQEVVVSGAPGQVDRINPIQTEFISQRTLAKAACCNLSESFETNASVSVSYSDAVTGAKQIQFLGLGGQYVQTNVENIPTVRGLSTAFGLNYIPGTWITGIDVGKGAGSVVNGYESMSGQMNVELQKPDAAGAGQQQALFLNGYVNSFGRLEGNVNWSKPLTKKWSVGVLGHASTLRREIDQNNDGFRDLPLYTQLNAINRYKYSSDRFMAQFGIKALYEDRDGGQLARFDGPSRSVPRYRFDNTTRRLEFFSKTAVLYPDKPYKGLGLILNGLLHDQTAKIGLRPYVGQQQTLYANLVYQNIIGNTNHTYKAGLSYLLDSYYETLTGLVSRRTESVPGVFAEYTYTYPERLTLVLGGRFDYHNLYGAQWTPRAHLKYTLSPDMSLRLSAGRGFRVANPLSENIGYLASSRYVFLYQPDAPLINRNLAPPRPEIAWNYGLSLSRDFTFLNRKGSLVLDYYRTDFRNQLVVNLENPAQLVFYNLRDEYHRGRSFANSFQAELNYQPARRFEMKLAYRLFDTRQSIALPAGDTALLPRMMVPRERVLLNVGYALPFDKWKADVTLQWNGPRRIPHEMTEHDHYSAGANETMPIVYSPGYFNLNAQISRAFRTGWEIYLGGENLTGFRQQNPIVGAADPYGLNFDAGSHVWGPVTGRMIYLGFRFKPQS